MDIKLLVKSILLIMAAALSGCGGDESSDITLPETEQVRLVEEMFANAPEQIIEKENLPVWLSEFIDSLAPDNGRDTAAYQAQWKGEDVYYVYDGFSSCIMCFTFHSDGGQFDWSKIDTKDFWESTTGWKCIYISKNKWKL